MDHTQLHQANQASHHQLRPDHADEQLETGSSSFSSIQHEGTSEVESNDAQGVTRLDRLPTEFIAMITQELMLSSTFETRHDFIAFSVCCKRLYYIVEAQKKAVFRDWTRMHYTDDQIKRVAHLLECTCIKRRGAQTEIQAIQNEGRFSPSQEMLQRDWVDKILTKKSWPWLWGLLTFMPSMRDVVAAHGMERQGEYFQFEDQNQQHEEACVGTLEAPSDMSSGLGKWAELRENHGIIFGSRSQLQSMPGVSKVRSLLDVVIFHAHMSWVLKYEDALRTQSQNAPWLSAQTDDTGRTNDTVLREQHLKVTNITRHAILQSLNWETINASLSERFDQYVERTLVEEGLFPGRQWDPVTRTEVVVNWPKDKLEWETFVYNYDPVVSHILISDLLFVRKFLSCKKDDRPSLILSENHVIHDSYLEHERKRIINIGRAMVESGKWTPVRV